MRLLDGFSRAGAVRLTGVLVAAVAMAACCVGVSSAAAEKASARSPSAGTPDGVSSDGAHVWVANVSEDTVSEIEASSGTVIRTIPVGSPRWRVFGWSPRLGREPARRYGQRDRSVERHRHPHDPRRRATPLACLRMEPTSGSRTAAKSTVSEIEASSGTVIRTIPVGNHPHGVSSDGTHVWVTNTAKIRSVRSKRRAAP